MNRRLFSFIAAITVLAGTAAAQSAVITPKKTVYRRPKPIADFKRTFTVRRPVAKVASPAVSRAITAAISPESVLGLKLKDELGEYQWLEEADYEILYNRNGVLSIRSWMTGTAAYPDDVTKYCVVDLRSGRRVQPAIAFSDLPGLAAMVKKAQQAEIRKAIADLKKDPEYKDIDPAELFTESDLKAGDLKEFSVSAKGVTFYYDYGFPHVIKALQPDGEYFFPWSQLRRFIRPGSLLARFVS